MKNFTKTTTQTFLSAMCLSASLIAPAYAAEITLLPDIPADQIARDTVRSFDSRTGLSVVTAPTFDPFEQDNTLAGTAALRTGPSAITIDGQQVIGGAYLDLKMIYTSASDDPYDVRGFEQAYYVSGDAVSRISQDIRTLDCASNTTEVVYEDNYYNNYADYGYLAGVYLLLPRYRDIEAIGAAAPAIVPLRAGVIGATVGVMALMAEAIIRAMGREAVDLDIETAADAATVVVATAVAAQAVAAITALVMAVRIMVAASNGRKPSVTTVAMLSSAAVQKTAASHANAAS